MHAVSIAVRTSASNGIRFYNPTKSPHSRPTSSHHARSTRITASTWATGASFTMPVSRAVGGADRWRTFLSSASRMAMGSGFEPICAASILTLWWSERGRGWGNAAIAS